MSTTTRPRPEALIRPDWVSKSLAGLLLGAAIAIGVSGLLTLALTATEVPPSLRNQLAMWSAMPVWMTVLGGCFLFRSGLRAWLWLGGASALFWGAFFLFRSL